MGMSPATVRLENNAYAVFRFADQYPYRIYLARSIPKGPTLYQKKYPDLHFVYSPTVAGYIWCFSTLGDLDLFRKWSLVIVEDIILVEAGEPAHLASQIKRTFK